MTVWSKVSPSARILRCGSSSSSSSGRASAKETALARGLVFATTELSRMMDGLTEGAGVFILVEQAPPHMAYMYTAAIDPGPSTPPWWSWWCWRSLSMRP